MSKLDDALAGAKLLLVYWRVPIAVPPAANEKSEERTAAKLLALIAVVGLGFAIRGPARGAISAALIPTVAAVLARILDSIVRQLFKGVHDGMILPVYVTTPLIMLGYLIGDTVLRPRWHWYRQRCFGHEFIFQISFSTVVALVGLLAFSSVRRRALVGPGAFIQGVVVALLSGLIVYFVAKTPAEYICALGGCASH